VVRTQSSGRDRKKTQKPIWENEIYREKIENLIPDVPYSVLKKSLNGNGKKRVRE